MIHTSVYHFLPLNLFVGDVGASRTQGNGMGVHRVDLRWWNYHLGFMFLLCCWCIIFPADMSLFLSSPSPYFNILLALFLPLIVHLLRLFHSPLKENPPMEVLSLLTSLAKITSCVPATWSTARPNVTTSATHSTTSFWIPHALFSLPALNRSEMSLRCQRAGNVPSFHCKLGEFWRQTN